MALPTTYTFKQFKMLLGNGATPEVFSAPCALTSRSFAFSADAVDTTVPDCDDEEAAAWITRTVQTLSAGGSAEGLLSAADLVTWRAWMVSAAAKNCRILFDRPGANGGGYFQGAFVITNLEFTGERAGLTEISVTLASSGEITWTANA